MRAISSIGSNTTSGAMEINLDDNDMSQDDANRAYDEIQAELYEQNSNYISNEFYNEIKPTIGTDVTNTIGGI